MNNTKENLPNKNEFLIYSDCKEETYIRRINKDFENLHAFSKILDDKNLNGYFCFFFNKLLFNLNFIIKIRFCVDVPRLTEMLRDVSAKHLDVKECEQAYTKRLKQFLAEYFNTVSYLVVI